MTEKEVSKEKDVDQIIRYLVSTFNQVTSGLERPFRSKTHGANLAYELQTEFAYLLNEVKQGPRCVLQKNITVCNEFIDHVMQELNQAQQSEQQEAQSKAS